MTRTGDIVWLFLALSTTTFVFMCLQYMSFENNVGKEEIALEE